MQQGVQTDAICNSQQCWELLGNNELHLFAWGLRIFKFILKVVTLWVYGVVNYMRKSFRVWSGFFVCFFVEASKGGCFFLKALIHFDETQLAFHHSTRKPSVNFPTTLWYGIVESWGWYYQGPRGFTWKYLWGVVGGGRDEAWDQETKFSKLAKQSPCVVVSR